MTHGNGFVQEKVRCALCGNKSGLKMRCSQPQCRAWGERARPFMFHPTCARQAGLEVSAGGDDEELSFSVRCHQHSGCEWAYPRSFLEDLIEIERGRGGQRLESTNSRTMSLAHFSRLFNASLRVLHSLGWAWRWAEWWVLYGSNW